METKPIETTQVSLPKGGGAIQGIGETFQANEFTGTASLSIPLATTPCRGFEPQLTLEYSSGSGNGVFGLGFALSIPNIARKTSKGIPQYNNSDTFLLSNAEDLVTESKRKEQVGEVTYLVITYRPRVEGLFAVIEYWCDLTEDGNAYWRVISSDNVTSLFGKTDNARISDPKDSKHIFQWLLSETFDAKGNRIVYQYKWENEDNVPTIESEKNRTQTANKYIEKIKYGNFQPFEPGTDSEPQWHFEVVFNYGEYEIDTKNSTPYQQKHPWANRQDPFSTYQAGFEIRTHRLCQSVLLFHRFEELGEEPVLVHETRFSYQQSPVVSLMTEVQSIGYRYEQGEYYSKGLPPLEFSYTEFQPENHQFDSLLSSQAEELPGFDLPPYYSLIDLYGEGIPGIFYSDGQTTLYWEPKATENGSGGATVRYSSPQPPATFPIERNVQAQQRLMDLTGNGQVDLVTSYGTITGYYEANSDRSWQPFQTFPAFPTDFYHPDNQLIDVTGDGLTDILRLDGRDVWLYPGRGKEGFGAVEWQNQDKDLPLPRKGSKEEIWQFADMFGSGMQHLVRITKGQVECWPSLGYGKFGKRVLLENAPQFGDYFDASRLFLADVDGSGTTDLIYVHGDRVEIWFNQSGNSFSDPFTVPLPSQWDSLNQIRLADVYGNGTTCMVFSENHIHPRHWCYDFCGGRKPYLLKEINNNLGAKSIITYGSSTQFYLNDKQQGLPWIVNLPFPVQVVQKTETYDLISGSRLVSSYTYHHGYYDGEDREFRGFGLVERWDAETLEDLFNGDTVPSQEETDFYVPPILTKTWYHTGACDPNGLLFEQYQREYFQQDKLAYEFPETVFEGDVVNPESSREAYRALKGMVLRQEVYGLDGSPLEDKPYTVTENNYCVKLLQPSEENQSGVYWVAPRETLTYHYERNEQDPRIGHELVLKVDEYGNVLRSCAIAYGRRQTEEGVFSEQLKLTVISEENRFINLREDGFNLLGIPLENKQYEIKNISLESGKDYLTFAEVADFLEKEIGSSKANLLSWQRHYYWSPEQQKSLPFGEVSVEALPCQTEVVEFAQDKIEAVFRPCLTSDQLEALLRKEGGYELKDNYWWNPGLRQQYLEKKQFYLPKATLDPFNHRTCYEYDEYNLLPVKVTDALNNETTVEKIDYQTLQVQKIRDLNQNVSEVLFDPMGMVIVSSFYGTENGEPVGFMPLDNYQYQSSIDLANLISNPDDYLKGAASYFYYDLWSWQDRQIPVHGVNLIAEDYPNQEQEEEKKSRILTQITYSDGLGRELQTKIKVDSGQTFIINNDGQLEVDEQGNPKEDKTDARWLTSGGKVYNNKGNPVKEYEPYYLNTSQYIDNKILNQFGVSDTIYYDPLERVIKTETAKGFFSKVEFTPWEEKQYDENDTVKDSTFYRDFLRKYQVFLDNYPSTPTEEQKKEKEDLDNEENALRKAEKFYNTPVVKYLDSLGQVFLVNDNGLTSYYQYDVQGRLVKSIDPRLYDSNLTKGTAYYNFKYDYGMRGKSGENDSETPLKIDSADAGVSFSLENAIGNLFWYHSPRHFEQLIIYDPLQRKLEVRSTKIDKEIAQEKAILAETYQYGESQANAMEHNLRGQLYQLQDQSGIVTNNDYSLQGELLTTTRQLTETYEGVINWDEPVRLESESYTSHFAFNAHQQLIIEPTPDGSITENQYNCLGLLEGVKVTLPNGLEKPIINHIDYNAKGQRIAIEYANGVNTSYSYEKKTWRLINLYSTRSNRDSKGNERQTVLQDIDYTYDPVGNITRLRDNSWATVFYNNQKVNPLSDYTYDAHYRLIEANGRQHPGINGQNHKNNQQEDDFKQSKFIHLNNGQGLENYQETYHYDRAGNLIKTTHTASHSWTRTQDILPNCDRLKSVSLGNGMMNTEDITYDESGNQLQLNGNSKVELTWNGWEQLAKTMIINRSGKDDCDYYTYDSGGMRTRKVCQRWLHGGSVKETETKVYLGNYEIKRLQREVVGETDNITLWQRPTLRVMDDETCVAIFQVVEENGRKEAVKTPETTKLRYQLDNHLGSVALEVDDEGQIISYEEYFPYGGTALIAGRNQQEVKQKEYRYCGKERDDSTGLYYYGARYYAPWLGRWLSCDPAGTVDGLNLFEFVGGNPIGYVDQAGLTEEEAKPRNFLTRLKHTWTILRNYKDYRIYKSQKEAFISENHLTLHTHYSRERFFLHLYPGTGDMVIYPNRDSNPPEETKVGLNTSLMEESGYDYETRQVVDEPGICAVTLRQEQEDNPPVLRKAVKKLFSVDGQFKRVQHSTLTGGKDVASAALVVFDVKLKGNEIKKGIIMSSGHYQPDKKAAVALAIAGKKQGSLDRRKTQFYDVEGNKINLTMKERIRIVSQWWKNKNQSQARQRR